MNGFPRKEISHRTKWGEECNSHHAIDQRVQNSVRCSNQEEIKEETLSVNAFWRIFKKSDNDETTDDRGKEQRVSNPSVTENTPGSDSEVTPENIYIRQ